MIKNHKITIAQLNPRVGDVSGNACQARNAWRLAKECGSDLLVFPELFISGYPPEDLVLCMGFQRFCMNAIELLATEFNEGPAVLIGTPWRESDKLYNAMAYLDYGMVNALRYKSRLPNYGPFDECRVFTAFPQENPLTIRNIVYGVPVCEDMWEAGIVENLAAAGAEVMIVANGSPFTIYKHAKRLEVAKERTKSVSVPLIYVNQVGGQDELVFDGCSFGLNGDGSLAFQLSSFAPEIACVELHQNKKLHLCDSHCSERSKIALTLDESVWKACVLGLQDYLLKTGFSKAVIGLSGGIDSAVVAAMCTDAIGGHNVYSVMLPSQYTSDSSIHDAKKCATALGINYQCVPINEIVHKIDEQLSLSFGSSRMSVVHENIQARTRGTVLMAIANELNAMLIATGNKSEIAVGYTTIYGDMNGGFNPIKDLYKTQIYSCANWRNINAPYAQSPSGQVIPQSIITKAPSAELRFNQKDQDVLPEYELLDSILYQLIEENLSIDEVVAQGFDCELTKRIALMVNKSEHKRQQAPPGPKISERSFGRDRRYPISNGFLQNVVNHL